MNFFVPRFNFWGQHLIGTLVGFEGLIIIVAAILKFKKFNTTINPFKSDESSYLITDGVYRFTRNPMYLGLSSIQVAFGLYVGSWASIVLVPFFIFYITKYQILFEEEDLLKLFGEDYSDYKSTVNRWI